MTSEFFLPELIKRERKRSRKSVSNLTITRKSFKDQLSKILSIPLFIDYYNHYMEGSRSSKSVSSRLYHSFSTKSQGIPFRSFLMS